MTALLLFLGRYARPYKAYVALFVLGLLVENAFAATIPLSLQLIIDRALIPGDWSLLVLILGALAGAVVLGALAGVGRDYVYARLGTAVLNDIRLDMFDHLQRLSMDFYARARVGDIVARFSSDLATIEAATTYSLSYTAFYLFGTALGTILLFTLEWRLALVVALGLPLALVGPRVLGPRASAASYRARQEEAGIAGTVQEHVGAQAVVKAFGLEQVAQARFRERLADLSRASVRFRLLSASVERTPYIAVNVLQMLVLGLGALLVFQGDLSIGSLVAFNALFLNVSWGVTAMGETLLPLLAATGGLERVQELLRERPGVVDADDARPLPRLTQGIAFRDVTFGYTDEQVNLERVSFAISHGWSVAFVGQSGSGKSTVLNLLSRFYDPAAGAVTIDGLDLRQVAQDSVRAQIGIVFQENVLFNITIRENIRIGRPAATDEEVAAAARAAEIHEFIVGLPHGYDTPVGERGGRLSGGQRQRLAIARALLREPAVLVLDEATSALDAATEATLSATLERAGRGRTTVAVTHRLATTVNADQIFVLDGGRLAEQGRHEELLGRDGPYRRLWEKQSGFAVSEDGSRAQVRPERLRAVPIFRDLGDEILADVARLLVTANVPEDRTVLHEGDHGDKFYVIVRGKVAVSVTDPSGEERRLAVLHDGDHFGELALLRNVGRTATVRTLTPCVFLTMQRGQFLDLLDDAPHLREALEATHLRRTSQPAPVG